ncbi:amidohydrolase family protein [Lacticaseibacillus zhaodongensis]|uniref:amidohydrolase family protein n=1 Tax=Lacticaseibacillus zhaodongensis TaxID=2668065 RepID=UPI0012D3458E|nr:amidohydrolase family protein [Lacticaseibacillus zhaodongensis]
MKTIAVEEHFESAKVNAAMLKAVGHPFVPNVSDEMKKYMHDTLPTPEIMQDTDDQRIKFMDDNGIDMQVLSYGNSQPQNMDPKVAVDLCKLANDDIAARMAKHPGRYAGLAVLPVGDPDAAAQELKRVVTELHLSGAMLKGNYGGKFFDDPFFFPIFKMASDLNVPIYFHPSFIPATISDHYFNKGEWNDVVSGILGSAGYGWHMDVGVQFLRMVVSGIFDKLPNLQLISGHWGELVPFYLERLDDELTKYAGLQHPISYYYKHNVYVTPSGILTEPQLQFMLSEVGAERVLYSIDYPYKHPANSGSFLSDVKITNEQRELIAHGNAEKLFNLK